MNTRERVIAAIEHKPVDRIPTDIWATPEIAKKLTDYYGSFEIALKNLHIDGIVWVNPWEGAETKKLSNNEYQDFWQIRTKEVQNESGSYFEQTYYPLADCKTIADLDKYQWPQTSWFDYDKIAEDAAKKHKDTIVNCGYMSPFYMHNQLRGLESSLMDFYENPEFTKHLLNYISSFLLEHHRRIFENCKGNIDVAQVTDDLGSQSGPMISLSIYQEFLMPHHKAMIDLCKEYGIKVFHHDDGSMRQFIPYLIDMGIDILNPIQHDCPGMDMNELKEQFGTKICFHGAIDNQSVLPFGTPEDVRQEVRRCIDALASDKTGYILAPCHNIQSCTPVENIIAMYNEAFEYGHFAKHSNT